jgi:hypothetical protein
MDPSLGGAGPALDAAAARLPLFPRLDPSHLGRLVQMAAKNRRLAGNSKRAAAAPATSLGNSYRRVRVGP